MAKQLRNFTLDDLDHFKVDADGDLYWKGRKIRAGGWTTANRLAFVGLLVALIAPVVLVLANLPAIIAALASIWAWIWS